MTFQDTSALYGVLAQRYDVGFSQGITDEIDRLERRDIQLLEIKELNDLLAEYRARIRTLVRSYRNIRDKDDKSSLRQLYASHEGVLMRRQIADLWEVYRIITADVHEMTGSYLQGFGF